ncbi:proteinase-activated receptor 1-like isoform X2 [Lithobates pipiens]
MALSVVYGQNMKLKLLFPIFILSVPSWTVLCENQTTGNITDLRNDSVSVGLVDGNITDLRNDSLSVGLVDDFLEPPSVAYSFPHFGNEKELNLTEMLLLVPNERITVTTQHYLSSLWLTKFVPSVYTLVVAVSLPLNVMAIIVCVFKVKIKAPAVVYMLNLAAADVLFVSVLPFNIAYRFSGNNWNVGDGMCRFVTAAFYCNMYCSILLMTGISVDRFVAVVYTMKALTWRTKKRAWLVCFFIWIISIASSLPLLISKQTIDIVNITTCHDVLDLGDLQNFYMYYFTTFSLVFFFLPLVITTVCYIGIIRTLSTKDIENSCKKTRAVILAAVVFFGFLICFGPTNVILLIHYLHFRNNYDESMYFAYILCTCISSVSTCLDPLIYYYASSKYRKHAYSLLGCRKAKANAVHSATQQLTGQKESSTENTSTLY